MGDEIVADEYTCVTREGQLLQEGAWGTSFHGEELEASQEDASGRVRVFAFLEAPD